MPVTPAKSDRESVRRSATKNTSYVDLTVDSDDDEEDDDDSDDVAPLRSSKRGNRDTTGSSSKRAKVLRSPSTDVEVIDPDDEDGDEEEYEIDYIVDSRIRRVDGERILEFLVHWLGYAVDDRSWTDASQFEADDPPVLAFYKKNPKKPKLPLPLPDPTPTHSASATKTREYTNSNTKNKITPSKILDPKSWFTKTRVTTGKENESESTSAKPSGKIDLRRSRSPKKSSSSAAKTTKVTKGFGEKEKKRKRKLESDESDFVLDEEEEEDKLSEDESVVSVVESDAFQSGSEAEEAMDISEDDAPKAKKFGGWGNKVKSAKKPKVSIGNYKTGVVPLTNDKEYDVVKAIRNLSQDLPPINDVETMFDHLTSRIPDIVNLVKRLNGRKLRVATMCSGTESPLLALNMIAKAIKAQHGLTLGFDHVFSCEIEPFKQAYIERNFSPPILFRDVTELGKKRAHTAYGSMATVPGNVDILIAGTSCVDYSNLNNVQQDIEANGESGRTFRGMLQWVKKHQPPIVILENVCSAPWDKVVQYFAQVEYDAQFTRLDTKEYYIPHTRTRVYLFATPMKKGDTTHRSEKWVATVKDLRRPWSSPFEAFLLPTDDPNIHRARLDLASAKAQRDGTQRKATDWGRCESRHARARLEEQLGILRPLTAWQEAGVCKGLDFTWNDYLSTQTERVLDLLEISTLRMAKEGVDPAYKACIWNVSQNVDRQTGSGKTALAPCLTPNMIPWITIRGGPATGREALALQGIPVRELLLTSENEDQLADLAGNAMTTTVVGASMLAALMVSLDKIEKGTNAAEDEARIIEEAAVDDDLVDRRVVGEENLQQYKLDLAKVAVADLKETMDLAARSSRHCQCEGQTGTAVAVIDECVACGFRACKTCGGRPDHEYSICKDIRVEPTAFEKKFKELLPMRVQIAGITLDSLDNVRRQAEIDGKGSVTDKDWKMWSDSVLEGVSDAEFRFRHLKRQTTWTAVYEAPNATLDLFLQNTIPEWRLTIKAPISETVSSRLRALLLHPVARLRFDANGHDVLCGPWELCIPARQTFKIDIKGAGELVPTWHASLGLQGEYEGTKRWSQLEISVPPEADLALDRPLSGTYTLLPKCGQAMSSLHKKEPDQGAADQGLPQLFMFLDPTRCGDASEDSYVFSTSIERLDYGIERAVVAVLDPKWRESSRETDKVRLDVRGGWVVCHEAHLTAVGGSDIVVDDQDSNKDIHRDTATYSIPTSANSVSVKLDNEACTHATALLSCKVPLDPSHSESMWRQGAWGEVDLLHQGNTTFSNLAWVTERLPALEALSSWTSLADADEDGSACQRCAPLPPKIHWIKKAGKLNKNGGKTKSTIVAFEDKLEAGRYEHALKNRPAPFVVQLRLDDRIGSFRIGLNIVSLAHRALSRLPANNKGQVRLSWRLTPGQIADVPRPPRVFTLPSNKKDPEHPQPKGFLLDLRKEQLRSLSWMLAQESAEGKTHTFVEEEISEAMIPALGWRAEGKAERPVMVRGGVIADQVGYGKTIISLGLIGETRLIAAPEPAPPGFIEINATLIVVPGHLSKQWPSEIERFTGNMFKVIVIQNMKDLQLNSIADLSKADIIVVACEIFETDAYWQRFEYLSTQPEDWLSDKNGGRFFVDRLETAMASLRTQTELLVSHGADAAHEEMLLAQEKAKAEAQSKKDEHKSANFGKRMKGQAYRDRYNAEPAKKKVKTFTTTAKDVETWEASEDEDQDEDEDEDVEQVPMPTFRKATAAESLTNAAVRKDYKVLASPVFHMIRFKRVIADEFTYLQKKGLAALLRLTSPYKWVLSGTPPVDDFPAIRSIAAFMGVHLGVEDDAEGNASSQKARIKEQTQAERFHAFREVHSSEWHQRRDDHAQEFLNVFVRQNIAEIEDIPTVEHVHRIKLPASEHAVYLELEHHLQALEMQARKETKLKDVTQGDRNQRLEEALADSKTAEEALLKRCCHFTLDLTDKKRDAKSAQEACEHIAGTRRTQLNGCEEDLRRTINNAVGINCLIKKKGGFTSDDRQFFKEWVKFSFDPDQHQGDVEAAQRLVRVLQKCGFDNGTIPSESADSKPPKVDKKATLSDIKWTLREQSHLLRKLSKELVGRLRSLRFFDVVRKLQRNGEEAVEVLEASTCGHKPSTEPGIEMAVLSCCGHIACYECMVKAANLQRCIQGDQCHAAVRHTNVVKVSSLGIEGELSSGRFGAKLLALVQLIQKIPKSQRILVFIQFEDLCGKISEALNSAKIKHVTLTGSVKVRANTLESFQNSDSDPDGPRVLMLKMNDSSAAGSNLTTANHVIFLGPLFTNSLLNYRAVETQAIGRCRRYGQTKKVHIHRLLADDTIDVSIFESRRAELKAKPDYVEIPVEEYKGKIIVPRKSKIEVVED